MPRRGHTLTHHVGPCIHELLEAVGTAEHSHHQATTRVALVEANQANFKANRFGMTPYAANTA